MDWWKKVSVPSQHKLFAASYRYGFSDAAQGKPKQTPKYFSYAEAWHAYTAGYEAGKLKFAEMAAATAGVAE